MKQVSPETQAMFSGGKYRNTLGSLQLVPSRFAAASATTRAPASNQSQSHNESDDRMDLPPQVLSWNFGAKHFDLASLRDKPSRATTTTTTNPFDGNF
jgi:hypothetical protein